MCNPRDSEVFQPTSARVLNVSSLDIQAAGMIRPIATATEGSQFISASRGPGRALQYVKLPEVRHSWVCLVGDFLFSQWKIHHDWGIYSVFLFFGHPLSKSKHWIVGSRFLFKIAGWWFQT